MLAGAALLVSGGALGQQPCHALGAGGAAGKQPATCAVQGGNEMLLLWQLKGAGEGRPGALTSVHPGLPAAERLLRLSGSQGSGKLLPGSENIRQCRIIPTVQLGMQGIPSL